MTLEEAISFVINKEGIEIIGETRFVNYLNDLQAFDMPAVKRIVVTMVSGGYAEKLKHSLTTQHYQLDVNDAKSRLVNNEGFQDKLVDYVLNSLINATKKTAQTPAMPPIAAATASKTETTASAPKVKKLRSITVAEAKFRINPLGLFNDPSGEFDNYCFPPHYLLMSRNIARQKDTFDILLLGDAFSYKAFKESKALLPVCLGVSENVNCHVIDLATLPHLLVVGSTGSGKSMLLHSIILSIFYKCGPSEVKFVLIDPQRYEFSHYAETEKYYLAKSESFSRAILSEPNEVNSALVSITQEINVRYALLKKASVRDISYYNQKWRTELKMKKDVNGDRKYEYFPRIVIIIDEILFK